jgi:hypothetical protein
MKKKGIIILILLFLPVFIYSQEEPEFTYETTILKPGIGFEYFLKTLKGDNDETSYLRAYIVSLRAETDLGEIITMNFWAGGVLSRFDEMTFRGLPFSLALTEDSGNIYGFVFGGEVDLKIKEFENVEIGLFGRIDYLLGIKKEWDIKELNVAGKAEGKPYWIRGISGPLIKYTGMDILKPYASITVDYLFGKFNMKEKIGETLEMEEGKKFYSETLFGILLGNKFEFTDSFGAKVEVIIYPAKKNIFVFAGINYSF